MARLVAIGLLACALAGCGTVQNFERSAAVPYGGVVIAVERYQAHPQDSYAVKIPDSLCAADVALSAVGDTITLPVALALWTRGAGQALWTFYHAEAPGP